MSDRLDICEVGLRDGLQNQPVPVSADDKQALMAALYAAGVRQFELTSCVSRRAVPQMADAEQMIEFAREQFPDLTRTVLVVNERGYDRAVEAGANGVAIVVVVTDELARRNSRMTAQETLTGAQRMLQNARRDGLARRVYLAPAWRCPFEGAVDHDSVVRFADALWETGVDQLAFADTIGWAHPAQVEELLGRCVDRYGADKLAAHFHDTKAFGLANAAAALRAGIRTIDSSIGGLGGCPFAPGAAGNLATEDLVTLADAMGFETGIDLEGLWSAVEVAERAVGARIGGRTRAFWSSQQQKGAKQ